MRQYLKLTSETKKSIIKIPTVGINASKDEDDVMAKKETKEFRVDSLLTAAVTEFLEKGYEGASIDAIARKAGVSKGGFYYHFPNKEMLLMEANQKLSEPIMQMAEKAYRQTNAVAGLKQYIHEYLKHCKDRPKEMSFFFLSMSKALQSPVLLDYYRQYIQDSSAFFIAMFQRAKEIGELQIDDPEAYGISLMGALDGLVSYVLLNPAAYSDALITRFEQIWFVKERQP